MANAHFFPPIEPFASGILKVDAPHELYWEQCGNPQGEPILFLHGGPGAGCSEHDRCFFDPAYFRIVLFDQRGSGRSRPVGDLTDNTMAATARDIEQLRELLGIGQWHVFGGSYGSTISLYYAQEHPERCNSLVLRGIWLLRREEIDWWLYQVRMIQPELWLGKTHLLHAIGNACVEAGRQVLFVSAETFTNDLVAAIRTHRLPVSDTGSVAREFRAGTHVTL